MFYHKTNGRQSALRRRMLYEVGTLSHHFNKMGQHHDDRYHNEFMLSWRNRMISLYSYYVTKLLNILTRHDR